VIKYILKACVYSAILTMLVSMNIDMLIKIFGGNDAKTNDNDGSSSTR
jgi:hypothetical protein